MNHRRLLMLGVLALPTLACSRQQPKVVTRTELPRNLRNLTPPKPTVCLGCVRWRLPTIEKDADESRLFEFSDGTQVRCNHHGFRYVLGKPPAPNLFRDLPKAAAQLGDGRVAWLDATGTSYVSLSPLGPIVASHPAPEFGSGESAATVLGVGESLFVFGERQTAFRSSDGGESWERLHLELPTFARFEAVGLTQGGQLAVRYYPMLHFVSPDQGAHFFRDTMARWELSSPPAERPSRDRSSEYSEPRFLSGNDVISLRQVNSKLELFTTPIGELPGTPVAVEAFKGDLERVVAGGDGTELILAFEDWGQQRTLLYRRQASSEPFVQTILPEANNYVAVAVGPKTAYLLRRFEGGVGRAPILVWPRDGAPRTLSWNRVAFPDDGIIDPVHDNVWATDSKKLLFQHLTGTETALDLEEVPGWLGPLHQALEAGEELSDSLTPLNVDGEGTLRVILGVASRKALYLVRVRRGQSLLPLLRLPFTTTGQLLIGWSGERGYSPLGWETADGGEHWTQVDAYPDATRVDCAPGGCLVDRAQRVGWAMPGGFAEGVPARLPPAKPLRPSKVVADLECTMTGSSRLALPRSECLPARSDKVRWAGLYEQGGDGRSRQKVTMVMLLPDGTVRERALWDNDTEYFLRTNMGCNELGGFAVSTGPTGRLTGSYYRFLDSSSHPIDVTFALPRLDLSGDRKKPPAVVMVTEPGLLLAPVDAQETGWLLVSDDGTTRRIQAPPTAQRVESILVDGERQWSVGTLDVGRVVSHFDGRRWTELPSSSRVPLSLARFGGQAILIAPQLPTRSPSSDRSSTGPLGYFPLSNLSSPLPQLVAWSIPSTEPCGPSDLFLPMAWQEPAEPFVVRLRAGDNVFDYTRSARRVRYRADGTSCTDALLVHREGPETRNWDDPLPTNAILLSPRDLSRGWSIATSTSTPYGDVYPGIYDALSCRKLR
jgi:hypothetical protein